MKLSIASALLLSALIQCFLLVPSVSSADKKKQPRKIAGHWVARVYDSRNSPLRFPLINAILEEQVGRYWVGTQLGLYHYDEQQNLWTEFSSNKGDLVDDYVVALGKTADNRIWVLPHSRALFYGFGFSVYDGSKWTAINEIGNSGQLELSEHSSCLDLHSVLSMFGGRRGELWFETKKGLVKFDGATLNEELEFPKCDYLGSRISAALQDADGDIWIAFGSCGVLCFSARTKQWQTLNPPRVNGDEMLNDKSIFAAGEISCIYEDRVGRIWFGTKSGEVYVYYKGNGSWLSYAPFLHKKPKGEGQESVTARKISGICEDKHGQVLLATGMGLLVFVEAAREWKLFTSRNSALPTDAVTALFEDTKGRLWLCGQSIIILDQ